jgi:hypothetical protein
MQADQNVNNIEKLTNYGFSFNKGGVHIARTIMYDEMNTLLSHVDPENCEENKFKNAIEIDNCLGKRSVRSRQLTSRHLKELYILDPQKLLFRAFCFYWEKENENRAILTLLLAYARDAVLRLCTPFILKKNYDERIPRVELEKYIESKRPERYSPATLKSISQNVNSSFTKSGHLFGRTKKIRKRPEVTPAVYSFAILIGYLKGLRGEDLVTSEFVKILELSKAESISLAIIASGQGLLVVRTVGEVIDISFPKEIELLIKKADL